MTASSQSLKRLMVYICGDSGPFDELNPSFVARQKLGSELLYMLNKRPMTTKQVCSALKISQKEALKLLDGWTRINAIREESGVYHVNFAIFMKEDLMTLARASEPIASELADRICNHAKRITSLAKNFSAAQRVQTQKLLFAAVGCFILDWLGLKALEEDGLLVKNKLQPGNRNYLLFAREEIDRKTAVELYDKMYWGSHSDMSNGYTFTSFGDYGARYAFPDVLWPLQVASRAVQTLLQSPLWMTEKLSMITQLCAKKMLRDVAFCLFRLDAEGMISAKELTENNDEAWLQSLVDLLEDMNYLVREKGRLKLDYPIFAADDKKIVEQIGDIILPSVTQTIRQNRSVLERALSNTTPVRNKVAVTEVLNEAWHWIFAQTNKILAEKGFLYAPPKKRAEEARYIAWVAQFSFP